MRLTNGISMIWTVNKNAVINSISLLLSTHWGPECKFASFTGVTRNDYVIGKKKRKRCARSGGAGARTANLPVKSPVR